MRVFAYGSLAAENGGVPCRLEDHRCHWGVAMDNRTTIGRAEGILMERLGISADQSFDYLRRVSSTTNRKLVEVANEIASTGRLPDVP